jgi:hypothetical protein
MSVLQIIFLAILSTASVAAQDYCSLIVQVVDPGGNKVSRVSVSAQEGGGRIVTASTEEDGEAHFCDLGVRGVTITIGVTIGCQTIVRNLPLEWRLTTKIKILYDCAPCLYDPPPPIFLCSVLFRFKDGGGNWISGVGFDPPAPRPRNLRSDSYGRTMVVLANGEVLHTRTMKEGYLPEAIDLTCSRNLLDRERVVTLRVLR